MEDWTRIVGWVLVLVGVLDPLLGILLVAPRTPDPGKRRVLIAALGTSGIACLLLGAAFLAGLLP